MNKAALFLDRDGVINVDHGYVYKPDNFQFIEGIFDVVKAANQAGYLVIIVTNQAGIGRGYYSEKQFHLLTDWMKAKFKDNGGRIDAVYFCPHHPESRIKKYRIDNNCRKPAPVMLLNAQKDFYIDFSKSILVGDKISDIQAGTAVGMNRLFFLNGFSEKSITIKSIKEILLFL